MSESLSLMVDLPEFRSTMVVLTSTILYFFMKFPFLSLNSFLFIGVVCIVSRYIAQGGKFDVHSAGVQDGRVFVITGAYGGIGLITAVELLTTGATVVLAGRGGEKRQQTMSQQILAKAKDRIQAQNKGKLGQLHALELDLSSFESIRGFAKEFAQQSYGQRLDVLINNAGIMACPFTKTKDGLEMQMGTNHFGHFLLTALLMPIILKTKNSRIVNVASAAHLSVPEGLDYESQTNPATYNEMKCYGMTKLANIYFTNELHNKYASKGVQAYSLHPGSIVTDLGRHTTRLFTVLIPLLLLVLKTPFQGAQTTLFCALSDKAVPGAYHKDCQKTTTTTIAQSKEESQKWWKKSEQLCGVTFP